MGGSRRLKLRRPDTCAACHVPLKPGTLAFWDTDARSVTCLDCLQEPGTQDGEAGGFLHVSEPDPPALDRGTAGASAKRQYERLHMRRERRARDRYGWLGGVYLALTNEPQSTGAWAQGSRGERLLGAYLEKIHDESAVVVLHDRRIPGTRANIDHVAVTRSGAVWAIDAKNYTGRVQKLDKGGWFSTDLRLYVGRRECTKLVGGMAKQVTAIGAALGGQLMQEFGIRPRAALCFVNGEWSLFAKPFILDDVWIGWPKALGEQLRASGELAPSRVVALAAHVAEALPPA
jgi:Nuclease-related domain